MSEETRNDEQRQAEDGEQPRAEDGGAPPSETVTAGGVLHTVRTGLKVLGAELKWMFSDMIRSYETRQMRRRLAAEYAALGRIARRRMAEGDEDAPTRDGEAGIILSQIEFLEQEIGFLDKERSRARASDLERRKRDLDGER